MGTVSDDEYMEAEEVGHKQRATCVKFSPDNKYQCVTGGWDRYMIMIMMNPLHPISWAAIFSYSTFVL